MLQNRTIYLLISLLSLAAVAAALISQHAFDMLPCAWCVLQRLIYLGIALWAGLAWAFGKERGGRPWLACGGILILSGAGIASAWFQYSVASQMFSCDLTLADRVMRATGLDESMPGVFGIYASCMDAAVEFLGMEYALWSLSLYAVLAALALAGLAKKNTAR